MNTIKVESSVPAKIFSNTFDDKIKKKVILYVPDCSENAYRETSGWCDFVNILTYDPTKITYTLKIKHGNMGSTTQNVQSGERFALTIDDMENVQKVSFNGMDVTADVVNGKFTISDITELIKHYLNTAE